MQYHYPSSGTGPGVVNFQNGAITNNSYEGTVFLPNCNAVDLVVYNPPHWARDFALGMIKRFAVSNEPYSNGAINLDNYPFRTVEQPATRAQVAQSLMLAEGYAPYSGPDLFTDIASHWGRQWINMAAREGTINGYPDGTFRPNNTVTRGQFSQMVVLARRPNWPITTPPATHFDNPGCPNGYRSFADICYGSTFYTYIEIAKDHGLISGYACGGPGEPCLPSHAPYFRQNASLSRGHIMKMIDLAVPPSGVCW